MDNFSMPLKAKIGHIPWNSCGIQNPDTLQRTTKSWSWLDIPLREQWCTFCKSDHIADKILLVLEFNVSSIQKYLDPTFVKRPNAFIICELMPTLKFKTPKEISLLIYT